MPIIAQVGRGRPGPMILIIGIYVLLIAGSITMVYPFSLMISTSMTNKPDMYEYQVVPRFLYEDDALYRRYLFLRYETHISGQGTDAYRKLYPESNASTFRVEEKGVGIPPIDVTGEAARQRLADLHAFKAQPYVEGRDNPTVLLAQEMGYHYLGGIWTDARGPLWEYWQDYLTKKYGNVGEINQVYKNQYPDMDSVKPPADWPDDPSFPKGATQLAEDWDEFKSAYLRPTETGGAAKAVRSEGYRGQDLTRFMRPISMTAAWWEFLKRKHLRISKLNEAWGLAEDAAALPYEDWDQVHLPRLRPASAAMAADWDEFVNKKVPSWYKRRRADAPSRPASEAANAELKPEEVELATADFRWTAFLRQQYAAGGGLDEAKLLAGYGERYLAEYRARLLMRRVSDLILRQPVPGVAELEAEAASRPASRQGETQPATTQAATTQAASRPAPDPLAERIRLLTQEFRGEQASLFEKACVVMRMAQELREAGRGEAQITEAVEHEQQRLLPAYQAAMRIRSLEDAEALDALDRLLRPQVEAMIQVRAVVAEIAAQEKDAKAALAALLATDAPRAGSGFDAANLATMPLRTDDKAEFGGQRGPLRWYFSTCQFGGAMNRLFVHSDAMFNTVWLILLTIATTLTVNPMAAYALSRFNLSYTYKVLLLLLATMAFPPAVAMVPSFLILKNLNLLNTYWALVLPGMANGYSIFLLKGFFDALPKELYEAAEIDGASPMNCFVNITFPMSKPIFAINALSSFNWAYTGFMWAFVRCPDPKKWTLMVHVFNDNQFAIPSVQMAILVIASLPTLLMFLFCQKVILRGIIIPSFK